MPAPFTRTPRFTRPGSAPWKLLLFLLLLCPLVGWGQANISPGGSAVLQPFTIGTSSNASLPGGWKVDKNGSSVRSVGNYANAVATTEIAAGANIATTAGNGIYNFGSSSSSTDRAVGGLSSGSASKSVNVYSPQLTNTGSTDITSFDIAYNVEKYRNGSNTAGFAIQMYYSTNGSVWTSAGSDFLTTFVADADNSGATTVPYATE
jgi:hypothetical protein